MKIQIKLTESEAQKLFFAKKADNLEIAMSEFFTSLCEKHKVKRETLESNPDGTYSAELIEAPKEVVQQPVTPSEAFPAEDSQDDGKSTIALKKLISENFKKLNITIEADGRSFKLKGKNTSGKSSVIDGIFTTLMGAGNFKIDKPIQLGKEHAIQEGDEKSFNSVDLIVKKPFDYDGQTIEEGVIINCVRKFSEHGQTLTVKVDGKTIKSPASLLKFILGETVIADPTELWLMQPAKLKEYITSVAGISEQLALIEAEKQREYDEKFAIEQEIVRIEKDLVEYLELPERMDPVTTESIELAIKDRNDKAEAIRKEKDVLRNLVTEADAIEQAINDRNAKNEWRLEKVKQLQEEIAKLNQEIVENNDIIAQSREQYNIAYKAATDKKDEIVKAEETWNEIPDQSQELEKMKTDQKKILLIEQRNEFRLKLQAQKGLQQENLQRVEEVLLKRNQLFTSAKMPIPGLSIDDSGIQYKGVPLKRDQISEAEGIELCMDILIAQKPLLRLIACKNGHAFDTDTLLRVLGKAKYQDYQMIIERVADNETVEVEFLEE